MSYEQYSTVHSTSKPTDDVGDQGIHEGKPKSVDLFWEIRALLSMFCLSSLRPGKVSDALAGSELRYASLRETRLALYLVYYTGLDIRILLQKWIVYGLLRMARIAQLRLLALPRACPSDTLRIYRV